MNIQYIDLDSLNLDPRNPRLGRNFIAEEHTQDEILEEMSDWSLEELAISFSESGYWSQEALIATKEAIGGEEKIVVIEGNRRLAALKKLKLALDGKSKEKRFQAILDRSTKIDEDFFSKIPYILVGGRKEVSAFLGFRHVTGIKEWDPAEKAQFISYLIDEEGLTYEQVMRKIGSKTPTVRSHYIAYKLLLQMEETEGVDVSYIEDKFSVLYLSLRTRGVQEYLGLNIEAEPEDAKEPVPKDRTENLVRFSKWMFGNEKIEPLFTDSRYIDKFGKVLQSEEAVRYLEESKSPNFEFAVKKAGGDTEEILGLLITASDSLELAFTSLHVHADNPQVVRLASRLGSHLLNIARIFPEVAEEVREKLK